MPLEFTPQMLLALRRKIGFTQYRLAATLNVSVKTVYKSEYHGTDNRSYVAKLLELVEHRKGRPLSPPRRGWPSKPWSLAQRSRKYGYRRARFLLYMEGHRDDMRALTGRPMPSDGTTVWLERDNYKSAYWRKLSIRPDGTVDSWGLVPDTSLSYW